MIRLLWSSPTLHWLNSYKRGKISVWICIMAGHSVINLTIHLHSSISHQSGCPSVMDCGKSNEVQTEKRNRDEGMGGKSGGHQRWLNIQVDVTRCRIPDSDRCRTKGAVVYCYVLSPPLSLFSFHPLFATAGDKPLPASVKQACMADRNMMTEENR